MFSAERDRRSRRSPTSCRATATTGSIFNATADRLSQAIVGQITLDEAYEAHRRRTSTEHRDGHEQEVMRGARRAAGPAIWSAAWPLVALRGGDEPAGAPDALGAVAPARRPARLAVRRRRTSPSSALFTFLPIVIDFCYRGHRRHAAAPLAAALCRARQLRRAARLPELSRPEQLHERPVLVRRLEHAEVRRCCRSC